MHLPFCAYLYINKCLKELDQKESYRERGCIASQLTSNLKHSLDRILFKDNENLQYLL